MSNDTVVQLDDDDDPKQKQPPTVNPFTHHLTDRNKRDPDPDQDDQGRTTQPTPHHSHGTSIPQRTQEKSNESNSQVNDGKAQDHVYISDAQWIPTLSAINMMDGSELSWGTPHTPCYIRVPNLPHVVPNGAIDDMDKRFPMAMPMSQTTHEKVDLLPQLRTHLAKCQYCGAQENYIGHFGLADTITCTKCATMPENTNNTYRHPTYRKHYSATQQVQTPDTNYIHYQRGSLHQIYTSNPYYYYGVQELLEFTRNFEPEVTTPNTLILPPHIPYARPTPDSEMVSSLVGVWT